MYISSDVILSIEEGITSKIGKIKELKQQLEILEKQIQVSKRKIQATATETYFVSLPKDWCEAHGLKKGSVVTISEQKDSLIIIP
jgi:hypothetical protein